MLMSGGASAVLGGTLQKWDLAAAFQVWGGG